MTVLSKAEREVILTIADDEKAWHIYTDSRRLGGKLRKLAARWGVHPARLGDHGWEFALPLRAVGFRSPRTPLPESKSSPNGPRQQGLFGGRRGKPGPEPNAP